MPRRPCSANEFVTRHFVHSDTVVTTKVVCDSKIQLVMISNSKAVQTRRTYASLNDIARCVREELRVLMEAQDEHLER